MLIVCPSCASEYRLDAGKVGMEGRSVRCAACRETWFITPADVLAGHEAELAERAEAEPDPVADAAWQEASATVRAATDAPDPPRVRRRAPPRADRAKGWRSVQGLSPSLAVGLTLLAAVPLICLARDSVVRAVPQSAALFARVGLPVNLRGIEIRDVVAFSNPAELVVEGDLVGIARTDVPVVALSAEIRDAAGHVIRSFPVAPPRAVLGTAETARFRGTLISPPASGRAVVLHFADSEPARDDARTPTGGH